MARIFNLHGLASLAVEDDLRQVFRHLDMQLDPYEPHTGMDPDEADVVLSPNTEIVPPTLCDVHGPAGDGRRTGSDGRRCYLLRGDSRIELPRAYPYLEQVRLSYDGRFPVWQAFSEVVGPLLQLAPIRHGATTVHGAAVQVGERGVLVCGWSESGKTETALALAEGGARFISDKWAMIDGGANLHAFPASVGIRDWVLGYLPRLQGHLQTSARARLRLSLMARRTLSPITRRATTRLGAVAGSGLDRAFTLAGRLSLRPTEVAAIYGSPMDTARTPPLTTLAMLTTTSADEVSIRPAEVRWTAQRLVRSAAYERRALYELDARARYADLQPATSPLLGVPDIEAEMLSGVLERVQLLEVRAPFPTDPRRVADALAQWC